MRIKRVKRRVFDSGPQLAFFFGGHGRVKIRCVWGRKWAYPLGELNMNE